MLKERLKKLKEEELELEWAKAGFTRAEIKEIGRRVLKKRVAYSKGDILKEFGYKNLEQ